ncbi:zinc-dependent alcohol dehydrogenase family protein [Paraherbaspirillum soli]|uniref:NAD(P)-dependent alcohol dehydrogenase n=1 Tax=Paraherbaspirillum soli TaxID=631222 RepID=A0ABW0MAP1_9BURK
MTINKTMKVWELAEFGLKNLRLAEKPVPAPSAQQLLIRVKAVSLNYRDKLVVDGVYQPDLPLPAVPVSDFVGEVVATGAGVTRFTIGARVMGQFYTRWIGDETTPKSHDERGPTLGTPLPGALAEYVVLDQQAAVAVPAYLSDAEASTLPIAALTAWSALVEDGQLKPDQTVLVQGTGGVAIFAIQIASALGARVIATSSSDSKLARAKALGARDGINYSETPDWEQRALELTKGRGVDHVIEVVGGPSLRRSIAAVAPAGHIALVGMLDDLEASIPIIPMLIKQVRIHGQSVGHRNAFEAMNRFFEQHQIHPVIDTVYPFQDAIAAFEHLARGALGKVVVSLA